MVPVGVAAALFGAKAASVETAPATPGFVVHCQGLLLRHVFSNDVHSAGESVFPPQTHFVDLFTPITNVFLDSPRLAPYSSI